jgi:hypothetical protein
MGDLWGKAFQYQKHLRLHGARRLMIFSNATVESAARAVVMRASPNSVVNTRASLELRLAVMSLVGDVLAIPE